MVGRSTPHATPCNTLEKISVSMFHAKPENSDPNKKIHRLVNHKRLLPIFCVSQPDSGTAPAAASVYEVIVH
jgi:hypothetical protein